MKVNYDKNSREINYNIGDRVWLYNPKVKVGETKKLSSLWHGPFRIIEKIGPVNYRLSNENKKIPNLVHANRLKPFFEKKPTTDIKEENLDIISENFLPTTDSPPLVKPMLDTTDVSQDPIFQAEKILRERNRKGKKEYKIKWHNYPISESTWEPEENIIDKKLIENFKSKQNNSLSLLLTPNESKIFSKNSKTKNNYHILSHILLFLSIIDRTYPSKIISKLYDCSRTRHTRILKVNDVINCDAAINHNMGNVETFTGMVKEYSEKTTKLPLIYCSSFKIELSCFENFFTKDSTTKSKIGLKVTPEECRQAITNLRTKTGKIYKISNTLYSTHTKDHYSCKWMRSTKSTFIHFTIQKYTGYLKGYNTIIHQKLSNTLCDYKDYECIPKENTLSVIIWNSSKHNFETFHSLGNHTIQRLNAFILIPALGLGGAVQFESSTKKILQLDNGYLIYIKNPMKQTSTQNSTKIH